MEGVAGQRNRSVGPWTSIGVVGEGGGDADAATKDDIPISSEQQEESRVKSYLRLLAQHSMPAPNQKYDRGHLAIEGSLKLAQSIMFPRQNGRYKKSWLPAWYSQQRDKYGQAPGNASTETCIRSVSALGNVYG